VLLEFGRRRGYLRANPAADIKIRRRPEGEVSILTPDELSNLLSKSAPEIVPYVAVCAFAGLRPSEAASPLWLDIHLDTMQIEVKARHSKTRRYRLVPIQPNLGEWLMRFRREDGPIYYSRRKFREAYKAAGMHEWKMDILRHSYGTYRLPLLKSAGALALEMGNSPDVIFRHYRRPMNEATASTYFDLRPWSPAAPNLECYAIRCEGSVVREETRPAPPAEYATNAERGAQSGGVKDTVSERSLERASTALLLPRPSEDHAKIKY
jgi:integrase